MFANKRCLMPADRQKYMQFVARRIALLTMFASIPPTAPLVAALELPLVTLSGSIPPIITIM
ncbi:hypothetical protein KDW_36510 [Dictyobacter vulcani]|uniref:Uncharacterized protein n=2 Tax=Dictyobacter vulcani TaxID=2607529 RepID=A0A5J4KTV1_9CHLR|nr:hypothetical protein KDW_36510 [Dictyobacter vulcani]